MRALEIYTVTGTPKSELARPYPVSYPLFFVNLWRPHDDLEILIRDRILQMREDGRIAEVKSLRDAGVDYDSQAMSSIGYRQVWDWIAHGEDESERDAVVEEIVITTRRLAKKQRVWLRRYVRDWLDAPRDDVRYFFRRL